GIVADEMHLLGHQAGAPQGCAAAQQHLAQQAGKGPQAENEVDDPGACRTDAFGRVYGRPRCLPSHCLMAGVSGEWEAMCPTGWPSRNWRMDGADESASSKGL